MPLALLFFFGITLLLLDFTGVLRHYLGWMAKVQLLPAVLALNVGVVIALALLTLIFGRIYCSIICPLGVMQDAFAWLGKKSRKNRYSYSPERKWLRYGVLVVFIMLMVIGLGGIAALLAPYSSYGRIAQNLFQPVYLLGNNLLAAASEHFGSYAFYSREVWIRSLPTFIIAALTFVVIGILAWRGGRTYCNTVCPVGTVLSLLSRFSWLKVYFEGDKCRQCSLCTKNCKASCIDFTTLKVDYSRCVTCGDCLSKCRFGSLHYGRPSKEINQKNAQRRLELQQKATEREARRREREAKKQSSAPSKAADEPIDSSRRNFLLAAAMATTAAARAQKDKKVDGGMAPIIDKEPPRRHTPITPPGSMSAQHMARHCTACQLCVAECPNNVLRPSTDLQHFMQPVMSYERGYCRPECTRCSQLCPAGAIKPITPAEKTAVHIGHAVWVKKNCVVLTDGVECGNCARHCPSFAIEMVPLDPNDEASPMVPAVNETRCIGCGACENLCPARPFSAIYVEGHEQHRYEGDSES